MLRVSARPAAARVGDAWSLCTRLPGTLAALEQGRITLAKARQQTPGQLRTAARRAVLTADPTAARKRTERARRERGVRMWPEPDGMATLSAYLPAEDAVGVFAVLDEHARQAGFPGDERSMDARRGDALVDLVLGPVSRCSAGTRERTHSQPDGAREHTTPQPGGARESVPASDAASPAGCRCECGRCRRGGGVDVRVTVPYTALLGANDLPGELVGYGPIPAAVARDLAAGGTWRRILTDPTSGRPLDYGTTRYRPPAHLAGLVITRDQTCQFPGCRVPAHRCDIDHGVPYDPANATGPTSETNLGPALMPGTTHHRDHIATHRHHGRTQPTPFTNRLLVTSS